jgi:hypothetical protein
VRHVIWQKTKTGCHEVIVTLPTHWQGESNFVVGPFSSRDVADYFANTLVDFGQLENFFMRTFASGDAWYVEVTDAKGEEAEVKFPNANSHSVTREQKVL